ncbi:hypothetical protein [Lacticaseibacillus kribbianus]|uniref:hypothetical protein n=1 Tax=Lacticaseibacillus kribbianus TaxID=2926292 RepID=UPI001CD2CBF1|nr:hypothetical protein [Lacticaseibacillus kribbianus]
MNESKYTPISRGWLGFWSIIYSILLIVGAVGFGFAITFGSPQAMAKVLTGPRAFPAIAAKVDRAVLAVAQGEGVELPADTAVTPRGELKAALKTGLAISANFNAVPAHSPLVDSRYVTHAKTAKTPLRLTPLITAIDARLATTTTAAKLAYNGKPRQRTEAKVRKLMTSRVIDLVMLQGWGAAYPMLILVVQTAAIVGLILTLIVWAIMLYCSHSWQRFFKVTGRVTYVTAFLGGMGALVIGTRTFTDAMGTSFQSLDPIVFHELFYRFSPTWQHLAGWVAVFGLALALLAQAMRLTKHLWRKHRGVPEGGGALAVVDGGPESGEVPDATAPTEPEPAPAGDVAHDAAQTDHAEAAAHDAAQADHAEDTAHDAAQTDHAEDAAHDAAQADHAEGATHDAGQTDPAETAVHDPAPADQTEATEVDTAQPNHDASTQD